ncbi:MAG: hypothetical protein ACREP7_08995, partial [Lysobacter sp.]
MKRSESAVRRGSHLAVCALSVAILSACGGGGGGGGGVKPTPPPTNNPPPPPSTPTPPIGAHLDLTNT